MEEAPNSGSGFGVKRRNAPAKVDLRRFCRISLSERVPDESTVRKLTRRLGPATVSELTRALIVEATREQRFRPRAVRIDSTVVEADVKYPTDSGLASQGVRALAREGRRLARLAGEQKARVRDRSRAAAAASRAQRASRSGLSGRSSPTTPTRSPSGAGETLRTAPARAKTHSFERPRPQPARPFASSGFFRGK